MLVLRVLFLQCASHAGHVLVRVKRCSARSILHLTKLLNRAAELCQLTYQVGERRRIRRLFRKLHTAGKFISWLLPLVTILCLRIPSLRTNFAAFVLTADLPCQSLDFIDFFTLLRANTYTQ